jgi:peroxiredoxin family protein
MNEPSTIAHNAITAASALKMTRAAAWQTFAHAQQEAAKADALSIAPSDLLCGILLNTQAINAHHALKQLGVSRNDETVKLIRARRTLPATMKDILLSNLYGQYREVLSGAISETETMLVQRLTKLQQETLPQIEQLAQESTNRLRACNISDDAIAEIKDLREAVLTEITTIQSMLQKTSATINQRALSINQPAKVLSSWQWAMNKGIPPAIKARDLDNVFSKDSQYILCLAREAAGESWIENGHLLYALAADNDGPGLEILKAISVDPVMLRMLIQDSMKDE